MTENYQPELTSFATYLNQMIDSDRHDISPEEVLDEWRVENPAPEELAKSLAIIRQSLAELSAGNPGHPASDVHAEIQKRINQAAVS